MVSIQKKINFTFSPQQVVDCDPSNYGCNGGWPPYVLKYAKTQAIANNTKYPYTWDTYLFGVSGTCANLSGPYKVSTYTTTASSTTAANNCPALLRQVAKTPMVVVIAASNAFMYYSSGVLDISTCPANAINHAVYLVGVDNCNNWIIQNSWGVWWGINGFAKLAPNNTCNICRYGGTYTTML